MATKYPAEIDTILTLPPAVNNATNLDASVFNSLRDAIIAIQSELGVKPSGIDGTLAARLGTVEYNITNVGSTVGGDVSGSLSSQTVIGLYGRPLSNVPPITGQSLAWNGSAWEPRSADLFIASGDLGGNSSSQTVVGLQGRALSSSAPSVNQTLIWNGSQWAPGTPITFSAGGDLSGNSSSQNVIGLRGNPISSSSPTSGQSLVWNGTQWAPTTAFSASGDLSGSSTSQTVIKIQGYSVASTAPSTVGQTFVWNGSQWAPGQLTGDQILPAFTASLSGGGLVEAGQTVSNPAFTASYSTSPTTASFADNQGNPSQDVSSTPTSFSSSYSYTKSSYGQSVVFTLTAGNGITTKTSSATTTWVERNYYGVGAAGQSSEAFIHSLASNYLATSRQTTFTVNAGPTEKIYYAHRVGFGIANPTDFIIGGFAGGFTATNTSVSVTNTYGVVDTYVIYESDNLGLGSTTVTVQ